MPIIVGASDEMYNGGVDELPPLSWKQKEAFLSILLSLLALLGLYAFVFVLGENEWFREPSHRSVITFALFLLQSLILLAPIFFLAKKHRLTAEAFGWRRIGWKATVRWVMKGFLAVLVLEGIFLVLLQLVGRDDLPGFSRQESHIPLFGTSPLDIGLSLVILLVLAPVVEEFFFRGFLLQTLLEKFRSWTASLLGAGFFALIHFEFQNFGIILFLALILNWMYTRTRSIIPGIIFHIVNNALAFGIEWLVELNII